MKQSSRRPGRPERPLDPDAGPVQCFAHELRSLREAAGSPSYRAMAEVAGVSVAALSRAASGERLPSAAVVRAYARACGAEPGVWERRLRAAAEETVPYCPAEGESPYQGLARFEPGDRELFFGRARLSEDAVRLMREHRFAALVGASGSGKSSLLRAGVTPRLETLVQEMGCGAEVRLITPSARPAATHGGMLAPGRDGPHRVVVVDQFEEIFTLCRDRTERWRFVEQLLAAREPDANLRVVVAVGSGYHDRCVEHPGLAEALCDATLTVTAMNREELRDAVVRPATAVGLRVERELTARIVEEAADRPGALPMVSHALQETWRRRRSGVLTLAGYETAGGVHGAIAAAAEEVYGRFSVGQADTARRLLLTLVAPGDGGPDSGRPVRRADLREWPDPEVPVVLERLACARLVTLGEESVELAHEALITGWPRLRAWIEENRERLRLHRHLAESARLWQERDRDPGALYRGVHLAMADALFTRGTHEDDLTARERAFLSASRVAEFMERWTAARMRRRIRMLAVALSCVLGGALVAGQIAWHERGVADGERALAGARLAAGLADPRGAADPRTRTLLSIAAWRLAPLPESRAALYDALSEPERDAFTVPRQSNGSRYFLTSSGHTLLDVGGGLWEAWDVGTHRRIGSGRLPDAPVSAVSPDGETLVLGGEGGQRSWRLPVGQGGDEGLTGGSGDGAGAGGSDARDGGHGAEAGGSAGADTDRAGLGDSGTGAGQGFGLRSAGSGYVVNGPGSTTQLRAFADDRLLFETAAADAVVPSAGARLAAVCARGRLLAVRDLVRRHTLRGAWRSSSSVDCSSLAFDSGGTRLAAVTDTGVRVWDLASGRQLADLARPDGRSLAFTSDGRFLAVAGQSEVTVWRLTAPHAPVFGRPLADGPVTALAWDPGSPTLRYLAGSTVHTLDLSTPLTPAWQDRRLDGELLSPDGRLLATAQRDGGGYRFQLRDTGTGRVLARLPPAGNGRPLMAFSPDGRFFSYGVTVPSYDIGGPSARKAPATRIVVWDVPGRHRQAELGLAAEPSAPEVRSIALTAGGRELLLTRAKATGSLTGEVWNTARGTRTGALAAAVKSVLAAGFTGPAAALPFGLHAGVPLGGAEVLALGPDGVRLAVGGPSGGVTVWRGRRERQREAVVPAPAGALGSPVTALAFSPDGRALAVGYGSGALRLWDLAARQPLGGGLDTPGDTIRSLAFSADGGSLYAGGGHVPLQRHAIAPAQVATRLCARAGRDLSGTEWRTYLPDVPYRNLCDLPATGPATDSDPAPAPAPVRTQEPGMSGSARTGTPMPATPARRAPRETGAHGGHPIARPSGTPSRATPQHHPWSASPRHITEHRPLTHCFERSPGLRVLPHEREMSTGSQLPLSAPKELSTALTCIDQQICGSESGSCPAAPPVGIHPDLE
ncbi:helix-turn-helix domain-containing protein [Streptomyces sp. NBC_00201]|uniref:nSTAND1 domain-containing NTPase n=1 Tax=Streptomyces sp. NBC_00201 TaxID=2975679 RepID=UPI0022511563|nr:helix-turn-helix domain-containing protein [Streptomyces sp. NBC_00201]MCX5247528.1 helix-turn-helix domain-containing protein [Streptomyces sp. NBC_00201]